MTRKIGAVVFAAGKGKRMGSTNINKVALPIFGKPLILHTIELLEKLDLRQIVVVVGFAKDSVKNSLRGKGVDFAVQDEQIGTADVLKTGLLKIKNDITDVLVIQGDDSFLYKDKLLEKMLLKHIDSGSELTFLTVDVDNPRGAGRIVRDSTGKAIRSIEERHATDQEKEIKEVNTGCYIFRIDFLEKYLPRIKKNKITNEYYLTDIINLGVENNERVQTLRAGNILWRGVNTESDLIEAEKLLKSSYLNSD